MNEKDRVLIELSFVNDGKERYQSVSAIMGTNDRLWMDNTGYGRDHIEALDALLEKVDDKITLLQDFKVTCRNKRMDLQLQEYGLPIAIYDQLKRVDICVLTSDRELSPDEIQEYSIFKLFEDNELYVHDSAKINPEGLDNSSIVGKVTKLDTRSIVSDEEEYNLVCTATIKPIHLTHDNPYVCNDTKDLRHNVMRMVIGEDLSIDIFAIVVGVC